jgi:hypothetical protein
MDEQQQQQINQAAEQFADAVKASHQAVAARGQSAQDLNAQLTEQFFNTVNNHLRAHAEHTRQMTQELAAQRQRGQEAAQQLTQESVGAYMEFMNSMFNFSQGVAQQGAQEAPETRGARR